MNLLSIFYLIILLSLFFILYLYFYLILLSIFYLILHFLLKKKTYIKEVSTSFLKKKKKAQTANSLQYKLLFQELKPASILQRIFI